MNGTDNTGGYLIEEAVEFWPDKKCLIRHNDRQTITLQTPACGCLLELLRQQPQIVSQAELISAGWIGREEHVLPNTFYQTMLTLRQALKETGIENNIIITVRGRGLRIPERISIVPLEVEESVVNSEVPMIEFSDNQSITTTSEEISVVEKNTFYIFKYKFLFSALTGGFLFIIFIALCFLQDSKEKYFSMFSQQSIIDGCHINVKNSAHSIDFYSEFIKSNELKCDQRRWWYFSVEKNSPRISLIRCVNELVTSKSNSCTNDFYFGINNE